LHCCCHGLGQEDGRNRAAGGGCDGEGEEADRGDQESMLHFHDFRVRDVGV
jgi:hypothetical protein